MYYRQQTCRVYNLYVNIYLYREPHPKLLQVVGVKVLTCGQQRALLSASLISLQLAIVSLTVALCRLVL